MDLLNRLKAVIAYTKLSNRAFAIKCGITQQTLDRQLKGLRSVSIDTIVAVCDNYPEISSEWLMRGNGEMLKADVQDMNSDRMMKLVDTIATLQEAINIKTETISVLNARILQLEQQLNSK